jgi:flagellar hook-basal body complex protein FliE
MEISGLNQLVEQLRAHAARAAGGVAPAEREGVAERPDFAAALKSALHQVNQTQNDAAALAKAFETGAPDVALHDVMISLQKAQVSFQTALQVRNRFVSAYHDIMNMQV